MRRFWEVFGFVAIAHVLALVVLVGWLVQSGRLDADAIRRIRGVLATDGAVLPPTPPPPVSSGSSLAPGVSSVEQIELIEIESYRLQQATRRIEDEREYLLDELRDRASDLEKARDELTQQERVLIARLDAERERRDDEQFQQTVKLYESTPPRQAKALILTLLRRQRHDDVVAVLDAMHPQQAARILREFRTAGEIELAAQILDELRHHGTLDDVELSR